MDRAITAKSLSQSTSNISSRYALDMCADRLNLMGDSSLPQLPTKPLLNWDLLKEIFAWIHPRKVFQLCRLSKQTSETLISKHFAILNLTRFVLRKSPPESRNYNAQEFDRMLFHWPEPYQHVYVARFKAHLTHFWWGENPSRTGRIPKAFGLMNSLVYLNLGMGKLVGSIPEELMTLGTLQTLDLGYNSLEGEIPRSIKNLVNVRFLKLNGNCLTGVIPEEICLLANLVECMLSKNRLSGPIPKNIGNLSNLRQLVLRENCLTGPIPDSIGKLVNLRELYLQNNQLSSSIPPGIGNLLRLQDLYIHNNRLEGKVPETMLNLVRLDTCDLRKNASLTCDFEFPKLQL